MRFNFQTLRSAAMVFSLLGLLLFPWQRSVSVPAVYSASEMVQLFPQGAGQIAHLNAREGQAVREGEVLAELEDRALNAQIQRVKMQISLLALRLARSGSDVQDLSFRTVLESEFASRGQELNALQKRQQNLTLRAPSSGVLSNVSLNLDLWDYVSNRTRLGILAKTDIGEIRAYVPSEIVQRIKSGAQAKFIAEEPEIATVSLAIGDLAPPIADDPYMQIQFDIFGGDIETQPSKNGREMVSKIPRYQVSFVSDKALPAPAYEMRGTVHIDAEPESLGRRIYRQVVGVLVRESGF